MVKVRKFRYDFWLLISFMILGLYILFMVYPLSTVVYRSVVDEETGSFSLRYIRQFFSEPYYYQTLINSFKVAIATGLASIIVGTPLAYLYTMYEVKGRKLLQFLIILSCMSAPFIGAYAWILLLGRKGTITTFIQKVFGFSIPSIYGFNGILLVLTIKLFPLVFLYVSGALKNVDNSLLEASDNLGCSRIKRFFVIVLPLCMPSILAASMMVFMRALADFGTPLIIGEGYMTFPVIIYNQYIGEVGTNENFASAISVIAIIITLFFFLVQRYLSHRYSFSMNAMHTIERKKASPIGNFFIHLYAYGVVAISLLPQVYLVYLSFRTTSSAGIVFLEGYSLKSYQQVFSNMGGAIWNTLRICGMALIVILIMAVLISYLVVRRRNIVNAVIDSLSMIPYIIPGAVVGISLITSFNNPYMPLVGTATIMVIAMVIRRIPYTIRSSVAILSQIPLSIDEAAESLGAGKIKILTMIIVPMMLNGIFAGAIMSWVTLITELSSSILLYSFRTQTLNVAIYSMVAKGADGRACALSTILMVFTVISLLVFNKFSKDGEIML